jgi:hypothetical protein
MVGGVITICVFVFLFGGIVGEQIGYKRGVREEREGRR